MFREHIVDSSQLDKRLLQILQLCGSTLRSLDIRFTNLIGENLSEYKGTLPCLENMNMSDCIQLTNKGLLQILQLCGSTLRSLDIQFTNITGENLSEYKGTLPCLENMNMNDCNQLINSQTKDCCRYFSFVEVHLDPWIYQIQI